jgi:hypothetical protein
MLIQVWMERDILQSLHDPQLPLPPNPLPRPRPGPHFFDGSILGIKFHTAQEELIDKGKNYDVKDHGKRVTSREVLFPDGMPDLDRISLRTLTDVRAIAPNVFDFDEELEKQRYIDREKMIGTNPNVPVETLESQFSGK